MAVTKDKVKTPRAPTRTELPLAKETKNTYKFAKAEPLDSDPIDAIYIKKTAFDAKPSAVVFTFEPK